MVPRPGVSDGDWIVVSGVDCVVCKVRAPGHPLGDCEVVHAPRKPANSDVIWNGAQWQFLHDDGDSGYADRYPRLSPYVAKLKRGRWMM